MSKKTVKTGKKPVKDAKKKVKKLTAKEENFCQTYLIDFNATRAAKAAGYSANSATEIGAENLRKLHIQQRIYELREEMGKKFDVSRERIVQELAKLAYFDTKDLYDEEGNLLPIQTLPNSVSAAISGVEVNNTWGRLIDGTPIVTGETKKVKLSDKRAAMELLTKIMGYAAPIKTELSGPDGKDLAAMIPAVHMHIVQPVKDPDEDE